MLNEKNIELRDKLRKMKNVNYEYNETFPNVIWKIFLGCYYLKVITYADNDCLVINKKHGKLVPIDEFLQFLESDE